MGKKFSGIDIGSALKRRALATKAVLSGEAEDLRSSYVSRGDACYRILRYQRIIDPDKYPLPIAASSYTRPETFNAHLKHISEECKPLPLAELVERINNYEQIPDKTVVVTLDGGHMDNLLYAMPLLLKYRIPATIFLPTAFMSSGGYFFDDMVSLLFILMHKHKRSLPELSFINPSVYDELKKISPNLSLTDELAAKLILLFRALPLNERANVLKSLITSIEAIEELPIAQDFLFWDDVRVMNEKGVQFAFMGHHAHPGTAYTAREFAEDLGLSFNMFKEQGIAPEKVFAFPQGIYTPETMAVLRDVGFRYATTLELLPEPRFQTQLPMLLGRLPIFEDVAYCKEIFICHLWGLNVSGVQF